jgi:hypothetical protein
MNYIDRINPRKYLPILSFMLIIILPLIGTIGIRHFLMFLLFFISILYLIQIDFLNVLKLLPWQNLLPFYFFGAFFVWVIAHYLFLSLDPSLELKQLHSLWLRSFILSISGIALGLYSARNPRSFVWLFSSMLFPGIGALILYLFSGIIDSFFSKHFSIETIYLDSKLTPGFFITIACAFVTPLFFSKKKFNLKYEFIIFILIILCGGLVGIVTSSKNTLIVWGGLVIAIIFLSVNKINKSYKIIFITMMIFLGLATLYQYKKGFGWSQMPQDIRVAVQIDKYPHWQNRELYGYPTLESGAPVTANTYERFAWGTKGLDLIKKYPMGFGIHNGSFKYLLHKEGIDSPSIAFTHSGWIDFTLGEGVPGTLLIWFALVTLLFSSQRNNSTGKLVTCWVIPTLFIYWIIGELSNKHYVEFTFFVISILIGLNLLNRQEHLLKDSDHANI